MIQLSAEQLLQTAFAVSASATAVVAAVFLLVLHATRRRRGGAWFWGWAFLAITFALLAAAQGLPPLQQWLGVAATCTAILSGSAGVVGAFSFRRGRMPLAVVCLLALGAAVALAAQISGKFGAGFTAEEIPLVLSVAIQAVAIFPMARGARMSGLQTAFAAEIVLTLLIGRTLLASAILAWRGQELTELYWVFEAIGGIILCFVLAMGELISLLDEGRVELENANEALNQALESLEVAAKLDPLTGLYNRYAFYTLVAEHADRGELSGSIAIIDLNGLKRINDTYGHHAGDRALLHVAMRLQEAVRQTDYVFRWGGDEFVLLQFGLSVEVARERMAHFPPPAPLDLPGHAIVPLTLSWGVAPLQADVDAALRDADALLYAQKRLFSDAAQRVSNT